MEISIDKNFLFKETHKKLFPKNFSLLFRTIPPNFPLDFSNLPLEIFLKWEKKIFFYCKNIQLWNFIKKIKFFFSRLVSHLSSSHFLNWIKKIERKNFLKVFICRIRVSSFPCMRRKNRIGNFHLYCCQLNFLF